MNTTPDIASAITTEALLLEVLASMNRRDKGAAVAAIRLVEQALVGTEQSPTRYHARACECALDISNWAVAAYHAEAALRDLSTNLAIATGS